MLRLCTVFRAAFRVAQSHVARGGGSSEHGSPLHLGRGRKCGGDGRAPLLLHSFVWAVVCLGCPGIRRLRNSVRTESNPPASMLGKGKPVLEVRRPPKSPPSPSLPTHERATCSAIAFRPAAAPSSLSTLSTLKCLPSGSCALDIRTNRAASRAAWRFATTAAELRRTRRSRRGSSAPFGP